MLRNPYDLLKPDFAGGIESFWRDLARDGLEPARPSVDPLRTSRRAFPARLVVIRGSPRTVEFLGELFGELVEN